MTFPSRKDAAGEEDVLGDWREEMKNRYYSVAAAIAIGLAMTVVPFGVFGTDDGQTTGMGFVKINSNPAVPTLISVDGIIMDGGSVKKAPVSAGNHTISFSDVPGYSTPDDVVVSVLDGGTVAVSSDFKLQGILRVMSHPAVKTTISVDGTPRDDYGLWTYVEPGQHTVTFGPVAGYDTPMSQTVSVKAGALAVVTGEFVVDANATESLAGGMLRVISDPAVPTMISVDGKARDAFGLNWLTIEPGTHVISFSDVPGFITPAPQTVEVVEGLETLVTGTFVSEGGLRIETTPPGSSVISITGIPRDSWGVWVTLPEGRYTVSFSQIPGHPALQTQTILVVPGQLTFVIAVY